VVNFRAPAFEAPEPGSFVELEIVEATPHSLIGSLGGDRRPVNRAAGQAEEIARSAA
jgi:hypothetical protein